MQVEPSQLSALALGVGPAVLTPSRTNGLLNMLEAAKKRARLLTEDLPTFPSLLISAYSIVPQGRFAEAQAEFLLPDPTQVARLVQVSGRKVSAGFRLVGGLGVEVQDRCRGSSMSGRI